MPDFWRSISLRIALVYAALVIAAVFALEAFVWWRTTGYLDREITAVIVADTQAVGDALRDFGLEGARERIDDRVQQTADEHAVYLLSDPARAPVAGNLSDWPAQVGEAEGWYDAPLLRDGVEHATRILHVVLLPSGYHLLVGRDVQDRVALRAEIVSSLVWTALVALVLAIAGGLLVRRAVLARIAGLNQTVNAIVHGDLSRRMTAQAAGDEFDQLARTINGMLDQIQLLIEGARNTSDAIAHDLRTPLAELRARLESVLRNRSGDSAAIEEVEKAVADTDRLIGVFNALLRLADVKSGVRRSGFRDIDPAQIAADVFELYEPVAEAKGVRLNIAAPPGYSIYGDPHLLSQALANLIDNAIKFTDSGGRIELLLRAAGSGQLEMAVADDGPGIPDSEKSRVVEKFQRGKGQESKPGSGLGLSLVDAIARLHGGTFSLADNHPGLIASLSLPLKPGSERALARPAKPLPAPAIQDQPCSRIVSAPLGAVGEARNGSV